MNQNLVDKQYHLSIRIHPDGFSLSVYDEHNKFVSKSDQRIENLTNDTDWNKLFSNLNLSNPEDYQVSLNYETDLYTAIPDTLSKPAHFRDFLKLHHPALSADCHILHTYYKELQCILIYATDKSITDGLQAVFSEINVRHHLHPYLMNQHTTNEDKITVVIRNKSIDCILSQNNRLKLLNNYSYETTEDIVFHVLNIYHHRELDHSTTSIDIVVSDETQLNPVELLKSYFPNVTRLSSATGI